MNVFKRIFCFLTVAVMFLSMACMFPVRASAATGTGDELFDYYLTGGTGDWEGVEFEPYSKEKYDKYYKDGTYVVYPKYGGYIKNLGFFRHQ